MVMYFTLVKEALIEIGCVVTSRVKYKYIFPLGGV